MAFKLDDVLMVAEITLVRAARVAATTPAPAGAPAPAITASSKVKKSRRWILGRLHRLQEYQAETIGGIARQFLYTLAVRIR